MWVLVLQLLLLRWPHWARVLSMLEPSFKVPGFTTGGNKEETAASQAMEPRRLKRRR